MRASSAVNCQSTCEGLHAGTWSIAGLCGGAVISLDPEIVVIPEQGDAVVELVARKGSALAPP